MATRFIERREPSGQGTVTWFEVGAGGWGACCSSTRRTTSIGPRTNATKNRKRSRPGKGNRYLKGVLGEVAAAAKTDTFLGERYRRLVRRRGKQRALVAVARSDVFLSSR
jgi:hypothetical protein